jgi:hypothetical protein
MLSEHHADNLCCVSCLFVCAALPADVPGVRLSGVLPPRARRASLAEGSQPGLPGGVLMVLRRTQVLEACWLFSHWQWQLYIAMHPKLAQLCMQCVKLFGSL